MKRAILALTLVLSAAPVSAVRADAETSVRNAYILCEVFDLIATEPCTVSGWNMSVDATVDMNSTDAKTACTGVVSRMRAKGYLFDPGWTIRIYSPFSGDNTIARCDL